MQIVCTYCQQEGRPGVIRLKEPLTDPRCSHGICLTHRRKLEEELRRQPI